MHWQPDPFPSMDRAEQDGLRAYMLAHNGWGELPPIIVDDEHNLIDGYKRHQVFTDLANEHGWPHRAPAYVIDTAGMSDAERRDKYDALRIGVNSHTVLIDEIEEWLRGLA